MVLLEVLYDLVVFGVDVVLGDVVVLHLVNEVRELLELVHVQVVLEHQFEQNVLLHHEVQVADQHQHHSEELQRLVVDVDFWQLLVAHAHAEVFKLYVANLALVLLIIMLEILLPAIFFNQVLNELVVVDISLTGEVDELLIGVAEVEGHEQVVEV